MNSASRARGGAVLLAASLLLVVATLCEASLLGTSRTTGGLFWVFVIAFSLSLIGYLIAALVLSIGHRAMVARSAVSVVGLTAFGVLWLVSQALYLFGAYFTPSDGLLLVSTILSLLALVGGLIAAIVIGARGLVAGAGRWALLIGILVAGITGGIAGGTTSSGLITVMHLISAVVFALVGLSYLLARENSGVLADAR